MSITVNGSGCGTYVLEKTTAASGVQQCNEFKVTLEVCTEVPSAELSGVEGTCDDNDMANTDASISLTNVMNADEANYSTGSSYTGPAYGNSTGVDISSGSGSITGLAHGTNYIVRIFNGSNDCYVDYIVSTPSIVCIDCDCIDYLYVNETNNGGKIHKFSIDEMTGDLTEILNGGAAWYPGVNPPSQLPKPHGLGVDVNGFLYVGENFRSDVAPNNIRKLNCAGEIYPETGSDGFVTEPLGYGLFNVVSYDGFIYSNGAESLLVKFDPCTGERVGHIEIEGLADDWGFYIDDAGRFYNTTPDGFIYAYTPTEDDFLVNTVFNTPLIDLSSDPSLGGQLNPPYADNTLQGITTDDDGNIYVVEGDRDVSGTQSRILKFTSSGDFITAGPIDADGTDGAGWNQMTGIAYSSMSNKLYTSSLNPTEDCIYRWTTDLQDDGKVIGPVPGGALSKAIAINTECCPTKDLDYTESICSNGDGERLFLQEIFSCGDGVVCEGQWSVQTGNVNQVFNECDLSITVNGSGCATYVLEKTSGVSGAQQCSEFKITLEVCTEVPTATVTAVLGTCDAATPNNDASISLTNVVNADQANYSAGSSYTGPTYGQTSGIDISSGSGSITGLAHDTDYIVRVFNGSNNCYVDYTVSTPSISCSDCDCKEYIYINEPGPFEGGVGRIHKLLVNQDNSLTEIGDPWFEDPTTLLRPHGLGLDINGYLYIGGSSSDNVRKLNCDGEVLPTSEFHIPDEGGWNFASFDNFLFINQPNTGDVAQFDLCTGDFISSITFCNSLDIDWGLYYDPLTEYFYSSGPGFFGGDPYIYRYTIDDFGSGNCIEPFIEADDNVVNVGDNELPSSEMAGIVTDPNGNIYIAVGGFGGGANGTSSIWKYNSSGEFVVRSDFDIVDGDGGWFNIVGLVYSETNGLIYTSNGTTNDDCISIFDTDLNYLGAAIGAVAPGSAPPAFEEASKAIGKTIECCPNRDLDFTETICSNGDGERVFLQEVFSCGEGIICEGQWSVETANANQIFNDCDLSITVNGSGCGTYVLEKTTAASGVQQCNEFKVTLEVCTEVPTATVTTVVGTCDLSTANNDASISIAGAINADEANYSAGSSYVGPAYGDASGVDISSGSGSINGLMHDTEYTVRIFNGSNDCYVDYTVNTPPIQCCPDPNCFNIEINRDRVD